MSLILFPSVYTHKFQSHMNLPTVWHMLYLAVGLPWRLEWLNLQGQAVKETTCTVDSQDQGTTFF
jgi:hypothetical protein